MDSDLKKLYERIYRDALYQTHGDEELARDLTQDAFLGYCSLINRGGVVKYPLAYLRTAVLNHLINRYHRERRRLEDPMDYQELDAYGNLVHAHILEDNSHNPLVLLANWELEELVTNPLEESLS